MSLFPDAVMHLWELSIFGKLLVALVALIRVRKSYPVFTLWACFSFVLSLVLWSIARSGSCRGYQFVGFIGEFMEGVLVLGVVAELAKLLFPPRHYLPKNLERALLGGYASVTILALMSCWVFPEKNPDLMAVLSHYYIRATSLGFFGGIFWIWYRSYKWRIPWRTRAKHIAFGFAVFFCPAAATYVFLPGGRLEMSNWALMLSILGSEVIWLSGLARKDRVAGKELCQLEEADGPLLDAFLQKAREVDRLLDRANV